VVLPGLSSAAPPVRAAVRRVREAGQLHHLVERQDPLLQRVGDRRQALEGMARIHQTLGLPGGDAVAQRDPLREVAAIVVLPHPGDVAGDDEREVTPLRGTDRGLARIEAIEQLCGGDGDVVLHGHLTASGASFPPKALGAPLSTICEHMFDSNDPAAIPQLEC
jgi:hypothetical protein